MFANRAAIDGSLLTVKGAGWEHFDVQLFPATVRGFVAGVLTIDADQHGQLLPVVDLRACHEGLGRGLFAAFRASALGQHMDLFRFAMHVRQQ